jgi:hypothetical protein
MTVAALGALLALVGMAASPAASSVVDGLPRPVEFVAGSPTSLSLSASPASVGFRSASALTGRLTDAATGSGVSGASVQLESRAADGSWVPAASLVTDAGGAVGTSVAPETSTVYRFRFGELGTSVEATASPAVSVTVRPLSASLSPPAVRVGRSVTVSGALAAPGGARVRLEQWVAGSWESVKTTSTAVDSTYDITVTPPGPGYVRYRVVRPGHPAAVALLPRLDVYRLHTYSVARRGAVTANMSAFRSEVAATYDDPRGWRQAHHRFREVERGGDFIVVLSQARYLPAYSWVCSTMYSCRVGRNVIINQDRWRRGSPYFPGPLDVYRAMLVNHETGHWLGRGHAYCPGRGRLAPVMQQQSKGLHGCRVNAWPRPWEGRSVSRG